MKMPSRTSTIKKYTKEEYRLRYSSFFFSQKLWITHKSNPTKYRSLKIYGYLSRGAYRRVKKQHASPRMTKNLRQPYEGLPSSAALSSGSSVCGCCQASKPSDSLSWECKSKHSSGFSKLYINAINRHEESFCLINTQSKITRPNMGVLQSEAFVPLKDNGT